MADKVLLTYDAQSNDYALSSGGLAELAQLLNDQAVVVRGLGLTADYGNLLLDVGSGAALVKDSTQTYPVTLDQRNDLSLTNSATNEVYVVADVNNETVSIDIIDDGSTPSDPHLKIGEVDTSGNSITKYNRSGVVTGDTRTDISDSGGVVVADTDDTTFTAGTGASVTVTDDGDGTATVEYSGSPLEVQNGGTSLSTAAALLNFTNGLTASEPTADDITVEVEPANAVGLWSFETSHSAYASGRTNEELKRWVIPAGYKLEVWHVETNLKGGGTSASFSLDVYDSSNTTQLASATAGSASTAGASPRGTSGGGATVLVRLTNSTGSSQDADVTVRYRLVPV